MSSIQSALLTKNTPTNHPFGKPTAEKALIPSAVPNASQARLVPSHKVLATHPIRAFSNPLILITSNTAGCKGAVKAKNLINVPEVLLHIYLGVNLVPAIKINNESCTGVGHVFLRLYDVCERVVRVCAMIKLIN